ncbi:Fic/DOC family protein [Desulfovibrio aminophilus]|uniref:Fic/DOC family protein n=1 Tax=Desulfovibrio aminophilus TaxID=81425 RepID=UPI000410FE0C|nr:Fic family protein [Desulfovibrio aminophilus]
MKYDAGYDRYTDPETGVLFNRENIREARLLEIFASEQAAFRAPTLPDGNLDAHHLQAIHFHLFQDVFDWAGEFRDCPLAIGETLFCQPQFIQNCLDSSLKDALPATWGQLARDQLAARLTHYLIELNAVHPFRDGNGRAIRAFIVNMAEKAGYALGFSHIARDAWVEASIQGQNGDNTQMTELLKNGLEPLTE